MLELKFLDKVVIMYLDILHMDILHYISMLPSVGYGHGSLILVINGTFPLCATLILLHTAPMPSYAASIPSASF